MFFTGVQYDVVQCNEERFIASKQSAVWYTLLQRSALQCNGVQYQPEQYSYGKLSELRYSLVQYYGGYFDFFLKDAQV